MKVWRITIKTDAVEGVDPRAFCLERNVLGVGWPVDEPAPLEWDTYEELGNAKYYEKEDKGWWPAVNALRKRMSIGDLCWTRDWEGNYYLGRIEGAWNYRSTQDYVDADVVNVRRCHWVKAGTVDSVPGKVQNSFRVGRAVQAIDDETVCFYSKLQFNLGIGAPVYDLPDIVEQGLDFFALASPEDCEDIVAIYLQAKCGYCLIPSTCRPDTAKTEFVLRNTSGKAQVQVKQGTPLDKDQFVWDQGDPCQWFLFSTSGSYCGGNACYVHCLEPSDLRDFAFANATLMPRRIQRLIEFVEGADQPGNDPPPSRHPTGKAPRPPHRTILGPSRRQRQRINPPRAGRQPARDSSSHSAQSCW